MAEDIIVPIAFFATVVGILGIIFNYLNNERKRRYALVEKAIESGQQIPENLLAEPRKAEKRSFEYFKNGIIFTFIAAGFWGFELFMDCKVDVESGFLFSVTFISMFFTGFGLAWLLIGWLRKVQEKNEERSKND